MDLLIAIFFIIVGFLFLVKGADCFVENASSIAGKIGVSSLIIGLTIVAFGTSMPELAVSVTAALENANEIAVGNVVGSNIFNLLVVAGLSACIYPLLVNKTIMKRDWPLSVVAAVLLTFMLIDRNISRFEGMILLICFGIMLYVQIKQTTKSEEDQSELIPLTQNSSFFDHWHCRYCNRRSISCRWSYKPCSNHRFKVKL